MAPRPNAAARQPSHPQKPCARRRPKVLHPPLFVAPCACAAEVDVPVEVAVPVLPAFDDDEEVNVDVELAPPVEHELPVQVQ